MKKYGLFILFAALLTGSLLADEQLENSQAVNIATIISERLNHYYGLNLTEEQKELLTPFIASLIKQQLSGYDFSSITNNQVTQQCNDICSYDCCSFNCDDCSSNCNNCPSNLYC